MPKSYDFDTAKAHQAQGLEPDEEVNLVIILTPAKGKTARLEELIQRAVKYAQENEPDVLAYHLHKEKKTKDGQEEPDFIMVERYKNAAAFAAHQQSPTFLELGKIMQEEGLIGKPFTVFETSIFAGFSHR
ncbi:hypothetical protein BDV96DRAFT_639524 [Lophiotrema nucula]|uniref:ABM domain-containing protein n=1 Tax=Lophiotrema nucula TaxID=690887 RepID=A0A6A5ZXE6_9PLEO|nr:hypothetical protein BDV96DRAFT_639524 [Lophiotrema nucula]